MRNVAVVVHRERRAIGRGWTILGLAAGAWALVFVVGATASSLFQFISSAV